MITAGLAASWAALLLSAWAFGVGLLALPGRPDARESAWRALALAGGCAALAAGALGRLLVAPALDVAFVSAHVALNLSPLQRLAALWSAPAGAALPAAAFVAVLATAMEIVRPSRFAAALGGATCMALLASSVAARPFAPLGWQPAEGAGLPPELLEPTAVAARIALTLAIAVVARLAAADAERAGSADAVADASTSRPHVIAIALLLVATLLAATGRFVSGSAASPLPTSGFGATMLVPLGASLCIAVARWRGRPFESLLTSVGTLGATLTAILAIGTGLVPLSLRLLAGASLAAAIGGALLASRRGGDSAGGASHRIATSRFPTIALIASIALAALAVAGEWGATTRTLRLTSGASAEVPMRFGAPLVLSHQGVSRYEGANSHVEALALDVAKGRGAPGELLSAERRDYVDTRESPIATGVARPAVHATSLEELRVVLDSVTADESVVLHVSSVPLGLARRGALALAAIAALLALLPLPVRRADHPVP